MELSTIRKLPNGLTSRVFPFHVSIKGLEDTVLCRDEEDYDVMVKYIAICARRKNVIIVMYAVVSNHSHEGILARNQLDASAFGEELKRIYSMWFHRKYKQSGILQKVDSQALPLENDWHVRNALAYIPRNAIDNHCPVHEYKWSGFRAMFSIMKEPGRWKAGVRPVSLLTKRERESIMHTGDVLKDVPWMLDEDGMLAPESFCDAAYLEQAFSHDPAFWLKTIGSMNPAEIEEELVNAPRRRVSDAEFFKAVSDTAKAWFKSDIGQLPLEKKLRLLPFLWRTRKTSVNQLARVLGLERETVRKALNVHKAKPAS